MVLAAHADGALLRDPGAGFRDGNSPTRTLPERMSPCARSRDGARPSSTGAERQSLLHDPSRRRIADSIALREAFAGLELAGRAMWDEAVPAAECVGTRRGGYGKARNQRLAEAAASGAVLDGQNRGFRAGLERGDKLRRNGFSPHQLGRTEVQNDKPTASVTAMAGNPVTAGLGTVPINHNVLGANFEDRITPTPPGTAAFTDDTGNTDALTVASGAYKVFFTAFPIEAFGTAANKATLVGNTLSWFATPSTSASGTPSSASFSRGLCLACRSWVSSASRNASRPTPLGGQGTSNGSTANALQPTPPPAPRRRLVSLHPPPHAYRAGGRQPHRCRRMDRASRTA